MAVAILLVQTLMQVYGIMSLGIELVVQYNNIIIKEVVALQSDHCSDLLHG